MIHLTDKIMLVEVPEDAIDFSLRDGILRYKYKLSWESDQRELKGSYPILGTIRKGKTDFDCSFMAIPGEMMVASILHAKECYEGRFTSLLQSKQVDMSKYYLVIEKQL